MEERKPNFPMNNPSELIYNLLHDQGIVYETIVHENNYTEEQTMDQHGLSLRQGAKSMILNGEDAFHLIVLAGDRRLDFKKAKHELGIKNKIRLATNEEIKRLMGCEIGSCYPIGAIIGLKTFVDTSLSQNEIIFFNPGVADRWVKMSWNDYAHLVKPDLISVSQ